MATNIYVIHNEHNPDPVSTIVQNLITRVSDLYRFMGVEEANLTVKHFRHSAIITGALFLSPSPRVCIDFKDETKIKVETRNVHLEPIF